MLFHPFEIAFCGYSGSGKTTLIREVVRHLSLRHSIAYYKHGCHRFEIDREGKAVFALPGNPVSALVCFVEYCLPALSALAGKPAPVKFRAALAEPFTSDKKRHRFLLGSVWAEEGQLLCKASPKVESHMITAVVGSNCLIEAEPSEEPLARGSKLLCTMLPWSNR